MSTKKYFHLESVRGHKREREREKEGKRERTTYARDRHIDSKSLLERFY